jgi:hypothetical protein
MQDVDTAVAVADATLRENSNPLTENDRILASRLTATNCASQRQDAACSTLIDPEAALPEGDERLQLPHLPDDLFDLRARLSLAKG